MKIPEKLIEKALYCCFERLYTKKDLVRAISQQSKELIKLEEDFNNKKIDESYYRLNKEATIEDIRFLRSELGRFRAEFIKVKDIEAVFNKLKVRN